MSRGRARRASGSGALVLAALCSCACSRPPPERSEEPRADAAASPSVTSAMPRRTPAVLAPELAWDAPSSFEALPAAGAFRKAAYRVPRAPGDSEDGELTVVVASGSVEQNVARWRGQFDLDAASDAAKHDQRQMAGMTLTLVELHGRYKGMAMGGGPAPEPKAGYAMLAAIVPTQPAAYFFKLVGPRATVEAAKSGFDALLASLRLP